MSTTSTTVTLTTYLGKDREDKITILRTKRGR